MSEDEELLADYVATNSEPAFTALVERYMNVVYSTALRRVQSPQLAEEISQSVFIILSQKAAKLGPGTILSGWLYRTTYWVAANAARREWRRRQIEQEVVMQESSNNEIPSQLPPHFEEAMITLGEGERDALLLRFFEEKSLEEVGQAMGIDARAAQKRVARGVEKLRRYFARRGVTISAGMIAGALAAHAAQAAPASLVAKAVAVSLASAGTTSSATTLAHEAIRFMQWLSLKTTLGYGAAAAVGIFAVVAVSQVGSPTPFFASASPAPVPTNAPPPRGSAVSNAPIQSAALTASNAPPLVTSNLPIRGRLFRSEILSEAPQPTNRPPLQGPTPWQSITPTNAARSATNQYFRGRDGSPSSFY